MKNILSQNEKQEIRGKIPDLTKSTILSEAVVRLWTAPPGGKEWSYSGLWGAILLIVERQTGVKTMKLFDLKTFEVVFQEELNSGMNYCADVSGFHTFEIENMLVAFEFCVSNDAYKHAQMVQSVMPVDKSSKPAAIPVPAQELQASQPKKKKKKKKKALWTTFFKSDDSPTSGGGISGPTGFKHVGGYNMKPGETSESLPAEMTNLFEQAGVTREMLRNDPGLAAEVLKLVNMELSGVQSPPKSRKGSRSLSRPGSSPGARSPLSARHPPSIGRSLPPSPVETVLSDRGSPVSRRGPPPGRSPVDRQPIPGPPSVIRTSGPVPQRALRGSPSARRGAPPPRRTSAGPSRPMPSRIPEHPAIPDAPAAPLRTTGGPPRKPPSPQDIYNQGAATPAARPAAARPPPLAAAPPIMAGGPPVVPAPPPLLAAVYTDVSTDTPPSPVESKSDGGRSDLLAAIKSGSTLKRIEGTARPEPTRLRTEKISLMSDNAKDSMLAKLKNLVEERRGMVRDDNLSSDESGSDWDES